MDRRNIVNGFAEMIKASLLLDRDYFYELESIDFAEVVAKE